MPAAAEVTYRRHVGDIGTHPAQGRSRQWPRYGRGRRGTPVRAAILVALLQTLVSRAVAGRPAGELDALAYLLLVVGPLALLYRRLAPVPVLAVSLAAAVAYPLLDYPGVAFVAVVVAVFTAIGAGHRRATWILAGLAYVAYVAGVRVVGDAIVVGAWLLVLLVLAEARRVQLVRFAELARLRDEQARTRAEQERRQASDERLRIARELHDVLGHHLSLIRVQAGVGLHLMDAQPEQARAALSTIKSASDEALAEVRSVLGILRTEQDAAPRAPAPGLDRVPDLAAEAGFEVRTEVAGEPRPVPAGVDRAAFRIVQEALTNVRRHAGAGARATVRIGYAAGGLTIQVDDDGVGVADRESGRDAAAGGGISEVEAGNGIAGMRERAAALGGDLSAGARPGGGFRVRANLPLPANQPEVTSKLSPAADGGGSDRREGLT
jgi:signal transduction histidine kinase